MGYRMKANCWKSRPRYGPEFQQSRDELAATIARQELDLYRLYREVEDLNEELSATRAREHLAIRKLAEVMATQHAAV